MEDRWVRQWARERKQKGANREKTVWLGMGAWSPKVAPHPPCHCALGAPGFPISTGAAMPLHFLSQSAQALGAFQLEAAGQRLPAMQHPSTHAECCALSLALWLARQGFQPMLRSGWGLRQGQAEGSHWRFVPSSTGPRGPAKQCRTSHARGGRRLFSPFFLGGGGYPMWPTG